MKNKLEKTSSTITSTTSMTPSNSNINNSHNLIFKVTKFYYFLTINQLINYSNSYHY